MCNTSKMLVLFFVLFIIQSNSGYRNEPFVFVKPSNRGMNSHSEKSDIYYRNKRQKLEQIRARHENKLTLNTDKYDLSNDVSKILLDNKDAEIFHNKNINVKRSAKFKSKANKNIYDKFGYIYTNEEEDSMKESVDSTPNRNHEIKHPFEKLILNKIKGYDVPLSKKKGYHKNGFSQDDKRLKSKLNDISNLRQNNAEFMPNLLELQKYRPDLNKAETDNRTALPDISNDDYPEDLPTLQIEKEISATSSVMENKQYETECFTVSVKHTEHMMNSTINKTEPIMTTNISTTAIHVTNTTEFVTTQNKTNDVIITKSSFDKSNSTDSSKNISTFEMTQNVSITATESTSETSPTTCEICFTLFPSFGTAAADDTSSTVSTVTSGNVTTSVTNGNVTSTLNGKIMTTLQDYNTSTSGVTVTSTLTSRSTNITATSRRTTILNSKENNVSISTTEDGNRTGKSQKLTKRNLPVFEYNLFESVNSDFTDGNNLLQDMTLTTCVEVDELLTSGTTESLRNTIEGDLQSQTIMKEENKLLPIDSTNESHMTIEIPTQSSESPVQTTESCMTVFRYTIPEREKPNVTVVTVLETENVTSVMPAVTIANLTVLNNPEYNIPSTWLEETTSTSSSTIKNKEESETSTLPSISPFIDTLMTKIDMTKLDKLSTSNLTVNVSLHLGQMVTPLMLPNTTFIVNTQIINYTYPPTQTVHEYEKLQVSASQNVTTECITTGPITLETTQLQHITENTTQPASVLPATTSTQNETMTTKHGFVMKLPHIKLPLINNKTQQTTELPICTEKFTIIPPVFPLKMNTTISKLAVYTFHKAAMRSETPCVYASVVTKKPKKPTVPQSTIRLILSQPASELPKPLINETVPANLQNLTALAVPSETQTLATTCITVFKYTVPPHSSVSTVKRPEPTFQQSINPPTLDKVSLKTLSPTVQKLPAERISNETQTLATTCMTVFKHTIPSRISVSTVKPAEPTFQQSITPPTIDKLSLITLSPTVQKLLAESISNETQKTSRITVLKYTAHPLQHTVETQQPALQQLTPLTTLLPDVRKKIGGYSGPSSEECKPSITAPSPTKLIPESAPSDMPKPLTQVPSPTAVKFPEATSERMKSVATTCMTVFKYTVPPPVDRNTVKGAAPTEQQLAPQTTTCETISQSQSPPQTTLSAEGKHTSFPPTQILGPSNVHGEPCIPVPVVPGRPKGHKIYPIRHKGGDPGNSYYRRQPVTKRKHPLLCTTIKFVECITQYQPVMQNVRQNTANVFIPKGIATKAESQTCKPDSSDCSSCDFGNVLPEILPNKVDLPPNPMPPVNLDFPTNNDTNCVDINQILNFTTAP